MEIFMRAAKIIFVEELVENMNNEAVELRLEEA